MSLWLVYLNLYVHIALFCQIISLNIHQAKGEHLKVTTRLTGLRIHTGSNVHEKDGTSHKAGNVSLLAPL